jgi:hypothetical protein
MHQFSMSYCIFNILSYFKTNLYLYHHNDDGMCQVPVILVLERVKHGASRVLGYILNFRASSLHGETLFQIHIYFRIAYYFK